jgi:NADH-quinone oxidoreductase subunit F
MADKIKILTQHINVPDLHKIEVYEKTGGYTSLKKVLKQYSPSDVVEEVKKAGVRGRGGAGFPMGMKWGFLAKPEGVPRYLVCNADESEPGTFKDHYLMMKNPHLLIEGMIISSYALGANKSFIYVRGELMYVIHILEKAIAEAKAKGYLGKNILGSDFDLEIVVHPGGGAYICGEETALLESLEGKRGNPRNKPPFPAVKGLYQCPTVVNNVESIANTPWIIENGGDTYAAIGVGRSTGTKLISASGHIKNPGVYELELGLPVEEFIYSDEYLGGIREGHYLKAYESLSDGGFLTGTMLGSGGFIVMDETSCIVRNTWNFTRFYRHESCGQCSPCREGTGWMEKVLHRIEHGTGNERDIDLLVDVAKRIEGNTICPLGDAAAWPVASAIRHFRDEFEWHINHPLEATKKGAIFLNELMPA